ncbi:hypothetical protein K2173_019949 [Erythroxylum novogranatense]|uniref:SAM domain-containing protein n=1 Tax=Erythroxylum novogranatense TaxID=1862640 RepID=A0AAV8UAF9_9ROSI|nr:hypothetical protein K2173_019949 [Erythroxylum novogranatense]
MSRPDVTITLGRNGRVVKKGGKRSSGEKVESNGESFLFSTNKRHRGGGMKWAPGHDGVNGSRIAHNDLRLKLMRKRISKQAIAAEEREKVYQQRKLSRSTQHSASSYVLSHKPQSSGRNIPGRFVTKEIAQDMHQMDSLGRFYSSQTLGESRARSPERILGNSSGYLPPRSSAELRQIAPVTSIHLSRGGRYVGNGVIDSSRPTSSVPIAMKATSQAGNPVTRTPPMNGALQNVSYMREEPLTVASFLHSLGLGKYAVNFHAEEVDMTVLKQMGDKDLKEMGIPMGPRKKILLALLPGQKRPTSQMH